MVRVKKQQSPPVRSTGRLSTYKEQINTRYPYVGAMTYVLFVPRKCPFRPSQTSNLVHLLKPFIFVYVLFISFIFGGFNTFNEYCQSQLAMVQF